MTVLKWLATVLLVWGLFGGIAYILTPLLTDGWGSTTSSLAGVALIVFCGLGLLRLDPRRDKSRGMRKGIDEISH